MATPEERVKSIARRSIAILCSYYGVDPDKAMYWPSASKFGNRGEPDVRLSIRGLEVHIEFKADKGRLSKLQEHRINNLRECGAVVFVVKGDEAASRIHIDCVKDINEGILMMQQIQHLELDLVMGKAAASSPVRFNKRGSKPWEG